MGNFKMNVGNVEIVALTDMNVVFPVPLEEAWPKVPLNAWPQYRERYPDSFGDNGLMRLEIGCYLVRSQGRTILIDTGYGPGPIESVGGRRGELMDDLASKSINPQDVDTLFLSHLHVDHVGWNTTEKGGRLVPTFPNARYVAHQLDLTHFQKPEVRAEDPYMERFVDPLVDQGVFDTLSEDTDLTDEVRAIHTPGHTPGHMSVMVSSQGQKALIQCDVFIHPAQLTEEDWSPLFDNDPAVATATRGKVLDLVEADGTPMISCHFPLPGFGRVIRYEGKRYWQAGL